MPEKAIFPMLAESNWWSIRSQFQKTLPSSVSVSYLKSLLNLKSDQSARNIISPLRQMGIIDDDGKPTSRANEWRNDEKYADVCKAIVGEVYPPDLADLFPEVPIDIGKARSWFMDTGRVGESAAAKITATYALLRTAKVNSDAASSKPAAGAAETKKTTKKTAKNVQVKNEKDISEPPVVKPTVSASNPSVHIDLQIHISPEASVEQIDCIFASIAKHLYVRE